MKATGAVDAVDVVALGESMVTFLPTRPGRLADVPSFDRAIGGAESNVACALAAAGHAVRWVSRVGADGFGDHLRETVASYGVDVSAVGRDPARPTGVYFRTAGDRATDAHEVAYYRAGSAASAMSAATVDLAAVRAGRILHLSGITAALSEGCLELLRELTAPAGGGRPVVSFDVNYRAGLWGSRDGSQILLELARRADVVFVGEDEAEQAWGVTGGPSAIREVLPEPAVLVVKQAAKGATAFVSPAARRGPAQFPAPLTGRFTAPQLRAGMPQGGTGGRWGSPRPKAGGGTPQARASETHLRPAPADGTRPAPVSVPTPLPHPTGTFEPAPAVDVVANVGAGDAFAAGFLSGMLRGLPLTRTLRLGHLFAAAALTTPADLAPPPARDTTDRLTALDAGAWGRLRLGPGWTEADAAEEEVPSP
ncbi:PfkB family carbohydrate kinase [Streptomyces sp. NPDC048281]|uniref:PfkB family carbohydrate kinase n=1 Tax=Streptomyces sp. NPDC048281 TaxID=3154715 RepID=UPI00344140A0